MSLRTARHSPWLSRMLPLLDGLTKRLPSRPVPGAVIHEALLLPDPGREPARRRRGLRRLARRLRELGVI